MPMAEANMGTLDLPGWRAALPRTESPAGEQAQLAQWRPDFPPQLQAHLSAGQQRTSNKFPEGACMLAKNVHLSQGDGCRARTQALHRCCSRCRHLLLLLCLSTPRSTAEHACWPPTCSTGWHDRIPQWPSAASARTHQQSQRWWRAARQGRRATRAPAAQPLIPACRPECAAAAAHLPLPLLVPASDDPIHASRASAWSWVPAVSGVEPLPAAPPPRCLWVPAPEVARAGVQHLPVCLAAHWPAHVAVTADSLATPSQTEGTKCGCRRCSCAGMSCNKLEQQGRPNTPPDRSNRDCHGNTAPARHGGGCNPEHEPV